MNYREPIKYRDTHECIIQPLRHGCKYANDTLIANTSSVTSLFVRVSRSDTAPDGRSSYRWWLLSSFLTALGLHSNYAPFQKLLWQLACWQNTLLCLFTCGQLWLPRWSGENKLADFNDTVSDLGGAGGLLVLFSWEPAFLCSAGGVLLENCKR